MTETISICYVYQYLINLFVLNQMKVELGKDPLFHEKQSPVKQLKQRQKERQKNLRLMRINPVIKKIQPDIQVIDPLPTELNTYKQQIKVKKSQDFSSASSNLRKYLIEQQKNLRCIREKKQEPPFHNQLAVNPRERYFKDQITSQSRYFDEDSLSKSNNQLGSVTSIRGLSNDNLLNRSLNSGYQALSHSRNAGIKFDFLKKQLDLQKSNQQEGKAIDIPRIEQLFENQQKQYVLFESKLMKNSLENAIVSIDKKVEEVINYKVKGINKLNETMMSNRSSKNLLLPPINGSTPSVLNEEDMEIDDRIEKKLKKSKKLRDKLEKQKKQMQNHNHSSNKNSAQTPAINFLLANTKKAKKKQPLSGVKSVTFNDGEKKLQVTPAISLLFQVSRLGKARTKKQKQLTGLINNSYKNRDDILEQKSSFYEDQSPFNDLSTSNQFKLRKQMEKRLIHRLELSREQVNKFKAYLYQIKQYHVILNEQILEVLKMVREELMSGKVMKAADLTNIVRKVKQMYEKKGKQILKGYPNEKILESISEMMV